MFNFDIKRDGDASAAAPAVCHRSERRLNVVYPASVVRVEPIGNLYINAISETSVSGFTDVLLLPQQRVLVDIGESGYRGVTVASAEDGAVLAVFDQPLSNKVAKLELPGANIVAPLARIGSEAQAVVRNRSRAGALIETTLPLMPRQHLLFHLTDGSAVLAQVVWVSEGRAGLSLRAAPVEAEGRNYSAPTATSSGIPSRRTAASPFVDLDSLPHEIAPPRRTGRASNADLRKLLHVGAFRIGVGYFYMRFTPYVRERSGGWIAQSRAELPFDSKIVTRIMAAQEPIVIPDLLDSDAQSDIALLPNGHKVRFFCGAALRSSSGLPMGVIMFADRKPRSCGLDAGQMASISGLAKYVGAQIELWLDAAELRRERIAQEQGSP